MNRKRHESGVYELPHPIIRVETWNGSAWVAGGKQDGNTYTATDSQRVRLTYTWERKGFMVIVR